MNLENNFIMLCFSIRVAMFPGDMPLIFQVILYHSDYYKENEISRGNKHHETLVSKERNGVEMTEFRNQLFALWNIFMVLIR